MKTRVQRGSWNVRTGASTATCLGLISAALVISAAAIPADAAAATWPVINCNDSGPGSLRAAVANAANGDTIDLAPAAASCREIAFAGQAVTVAQDDLTIVGPGRYLMALDGGYESSLLRHTGTGTLRISGFSLERGYERNPVDYAQGGCIYSAGSVTLEHAEVRHCFTYHRQGSDGGGIYAKKDVTVKDTSVFLSEARGNATLGGGIYAAGHVTLNRSRLLKNKANLGSGLIALDGVTVSYSTIADNVAGQAAVLIYGEGDSTIAHSTISGNRASVNSAGIISSLDVRLAIVNSTMSGNNAPWISAVQAQDLTISNSTIAHNHAASDRLTTCEESAAIWTDVLHMDSSILASNDCDGAPSSDLSSQYNLATGSSNLVMRVTEHTQVPADTISADPLLEPLADNGGVRLTHALQAGSPAINNGNNVLGLEWDQRGSGFPRIKGTAPDIGAYEY